MPLKAAIVPVTPLQQNCALVWDDSTMEAAVVDPGGDVPRILEALRELKLQPVHVLLTHGHFDHAGGAAELRDALPGVPLLGPDQRQAGFALVGDVIFQGSVGRTDFPYGDGPGLLRSIRDKVMPLGDAMAFLCGHGAGSTLGMERQTNPFVKEALALQD